jgi:hypothetical protein
VAKAPLLNQGPWVFESGVEPGTPFTDGVPKPAPDPVASFSGQKVAVVKDGKAFDVPVEQLSQAESEGYHVESDAERAGREYVKENPYLGAAAAGIQKVVSGVTFGAGDAVLDRVVDPYKLARFRAIQANSPTATAVGEGLGSLAHSPFRYQRSANTSGSRRRLLRVSLRTPPRRKAPQPLQHSPLPSPETPRRRSLRDFHTRVQEQRPAQSVFRSSASSLADVRPTLGWRSISSTPSLPSWLPS